MGILLDGLGELDNAIRSLERPIEIGARLNHHQLQVYKDYLTNVLQKRAGRLPAPSTLSDETIQTLAQNTYAVKIIAQDQLAQWQESLSNARMRWSSQGDDRANEVAFAEALLAILEDQTPTLRADNPYANVVQQVIAAIQQYRDQSNA